MTSIQELFGKLAILEEIIPVPTGLAYQIGWTATLICVLFSVWIAFKFLQNDPRMFTVMALFACSWMLVLGLYETKDESRLANIMTDVASFLDVYVGGLLILEGRDDHRTRLKNIAWLQGWALWLLFFIAVPRAIPVPTEVKEWLHISDVTAYQAGLVTSAIMDILGFVSIALGASRVSGWASYIVLLFILIFYGLAEIAREATIWSAWKPMPAYFVFFFAAAKLSLTATFCFIVVRHAQRTAVPPGAASQNLTAAATAAAAASVS
jgi:hypothetical protein